MRYFILQRKYKQNCLTKRAKTAKARSLKLGIKGCFTKKTIENLFTKQLGRCVCCGELLRNGFEVDHIVPLSNGGTNYPNNLQLLTKKCNRAKGSKSMEEYA
jgi:5-methylcytosine-specific restriction endonuclease McrA